MYAARFILLYLASPYSLLFACCEERAVAGSLRRAQRAARCATNARPLPPHRNRDSFPSFAMTHCSLNNLKRGGDNFVFHAAHLRRPALELWAAVAALRPFRPSMFHAPLLEQLIVTHRGMVSV